MFSILFCLRPKHNQDTDRCSPMSNKSNALMPSSGFNHTLTGEIPEVTVQEIPQTKLPVGFCLSGFREVDPTHDVFHHRVTSPEILSFLFTHSHSS